VYRQVRPFGKILSQQAIGVFIGTALPRALRIAEVHLYVSRQGKALMVGHLLAAIPGERLVRVKHFSARALVLRAYGPDTMFDF